MTNTNQSVRLIDFHNRHADFLMKGTWGYVDPELRARGFAMLTAESWVEELEVSTTKVLDDNGDSLPTPLICGTDKYGRYLELPIDRILGFDFLDTEEQGRLKALAWLQDAYSKVPMDAIEDNEHLKKMIQDSKKNYDELIANGVTLYQRGK